MINHIKWLRPIYCLHYRFMCFMNWDDFEDIPGLYDDDNSLNPNFFFSHPELWDDEEELDE